MKALHTASDRPLDYQGRCKLNLGFRGRFLFTVVKQAPVSLRLKCKPTKDAVLILDTLQISMMSFLQPEPAGLHRRFDSYF